MDRPDKTGREAILKVHLKDIVVAKNLDVEKVAAMLSGRNLTMENLQTILSGGVPRP